MSGTLPRLEVPLGDKCKAPSCEVVREVDVVGRPVEAEAVTS